MWMPGTLIGGLLAYQIYSEVWAIGAVVGTLAGWVPHRHRCGAGCGGAAAAGRRRRHARESRLEALDPLGKPRPRCGRARLDGAEARPADVPPGVAATAAPSQAICAAASLLAKPLEYFAVVLDGDVVEDASVDELLQIQSIGVWAKRIDASHRGRPLPR